MTEKNSSSDNRSTFKRWYDNNREDFNAARRAKYHSDPEYRQRAKDQANASRRKAPLLVSPEGYPYSFEEAAGALGVSRYSLRDWRRRGYFPEPKRQGLRLYFSHRQVELLAKLREFLRDGGGRKVDELETMKNTVFMNWEV